MGTLHFALQESVSFHASRLCSLHTFYLLVAVLVFAPESVCQFYLHSNYIAGVVVTHHASGLCFSAPRCTRIGLN